MCDALAPEADRQLLEGMGHLLVGGEDLERRHNLRQRRGLLALRLRQILLVRRLVVDEDQEVVGLALVVDLVCLSAAASHLVRLIVVGSEAVWCLLLGLIPDCCRKQRYDSGGKFGVEGECEGVVNEFLTCL